MGRCDAVLAQGVWAGMTTEIRRSTADNILTWLKTLDWGEFKKRQDAGMKVGLPIKGVPIEIGGNYTEEQFNTWKKEVDSGNSREYTDEETLQVIQRNADPVLVQAWLDCNGKGLVGGLEPTSTPDALIFTAQYLPNAVDDYPPKVEPNGFQVVGATPAFVLDEDDVIPFGGVSVLLRRDGKAGVVVVLNTEKGTLEGSAAAIPEPPAPAPPTPIQENDIELVVEDGDPKRARFIGPAEALDLVTEVRYVLWGIYIENRWQRRVKGRYNRSSSDRASGFAAEAPTMERLWGVNAYATLADGRTWDYSWLSTTHFVSA